MVTEHCLSGTSMKALCCTVEGITREHSAPHTENIVPDYSASALSSNLLTSERCFDSVANSVDPGSLSRENRRQHCHRWPNCSDKFACFDTASIPLAEDERLYTNMELDSQAF